MTVMLFSGALGKMIHEKKPEANNLVTLSLKKQLKFLAKIRIIVSAYSYSE
jgi:hypothetical protein